MTGIHRFPCPTKLYHDTAYPTLSASRPENSAKGKTVVITGGGTGIGAETARSFAAAGAGRILLLGRRLEPLETTKTSIEAEFPGTSVTATSTDVTNKSQVDAAFSGFLTGHGEGNTDGKVDVLISNAATTGPLDSIAEVKLADFMATMNSNVASTLLVAQAFVRHANPAGAVAINVSSQAAHMSFGDNFFAYGVAKLAAFRIWDILGANNAKLRVHHIHPGIVDTDLNRSVGGVAALGFEDHVSLPAGLMLWLASPEARFLKGKYIWANWDVDELKARAAEIENSQEFDIQLVGWPFGKEMNIQMTDNAGEHWQR